MRANAIYKRIKYIEKPVGVEIGVHQGETSARLMSLHEGLHLIMIDAWSEDTYKNSPDGASQPFRDLYENKWLENMNIAIDAVKEYQDRTEIIKSHSLHVSKTMPDQSFDFVFIDASHDYESVKADILAWLPKVKKDGWICGHDYEVENFPGVKQAVDELFPVVELDEDFTYFSMV